MHCFLIAICLSHMSLPQAQFGLESSHCIIHVRNYTTLPLNLEV